MDNFNPAHLRCRLDFNQAVASLTDEFNNCPEDSLKLLYLFLFDSEDRLVFGNAVKSNESHASLDFLISLAQDYSENLAGPDTYFMIKIKEFIYEPSDNLGIKAFFEAHAEFAGDFTMIQEFIKNWKEIDLEIIKDKPQLKRHMINFMNHNLGLPPLYLADKKSAKYPDLISLVDDKFENFIMGKYPSLLHSQLFWRIIFCILCLSFLYIFYDFSQNGRYTPYRGAMPLLDTRTGKIYLPYGFYGEKGLKPLIDPDNQPSQPKP